MNVKTAIHEVFRLRQQWGPGVPPLSSAVIKCNFTGLHCLVTASTNCHSKLRITLVVKSSGKARGILWEWGRGLQSSAQKSADGLAEAVGEWEAAIGGQALGKGVSDIQSTRSLGPIYQRNFWPSLPAFFLWEADRKGHKWQIHGCGSLQAGHPSALTLIAIMWLWKCCNGQNFKVWTYIHFF